jgi:hypothetical protein
LAYIKPFLGAHSWSMLWYRTRREFANHAT